LPPPKLPLERKNQGPSWMDVEPSHWLHEISISKIVCHHFWLGLMVGLVIGDIITKKKGRWFWEGISNILNTCSTIFTKNVQKKKKVTTNIVPKPKSFQINKFCYFSFMDLKGLDLFWFPLNEPPSCLWTLTRSQVTGWNPLEGFTKSSCGKLRLGGTLLASNSRKG
jgi:hypothetical protein